MTGSWFQFERSVRKHCTCWLLLEKMNCLYLHIPFCLKKCHYCSFSSFVAPPKLHLEYVVAVKKELDLLKKNTEIAPLSTLFIGGGTPTCLRPDELASLVHYCKQQFGFEIDAEISIEANPGTVDGYYFEELIKAGVNRLSIGVQSFVDTELHNIGRLHSRKHAIDVYKSAQSAGFTNINIDLMSGIPGQTVMSWVESLEQALSLSPQHLSLYQLMVEEGTYFAQLDEKGELMLPGEDEIIEMDDKTKALCQNGGLLQYETSNFAKEIHQCRHNINYWENQDYYAAGAASVSFVSGVREKRIIDPQQYMNNLLLGNSVIADKECLDPEASFRETVIMGLRMKRGVSLDNLMSRYKLTPKEYYGSVLISLLKTGMLELTATHLKISEQGWPFSNRIMAELV
jgi:oxygen-independent coproporphyrinogen-3 oxidase